MNRGFLVLTVLLLSLNTFAETAQQNSKQAGSEIAAEQKPQILIPVATVEGDYAGSNWFAVPISKTQPDKILTGKITFGKSEIEGTGSPAEFTPAKGEKFNENLFDKYIYLRNMSGLRSGAYDSANGLDCLHKSQAEKSITCTLKLNSQTIVITEEYLGFNDRAGTPEHEFTLSISGKEKLVIKAQRIEAVGDLNHDGRMDLIFRQIDVQSKTNLYSISKDGTQLELVATATSEGC